jgi:hypothetical protein
MYAVAAVFARSSLTGEWGAAMLIFLSLILLQATAATSTSTQVATAPPDDAKIVCRTITATGSRLGGKRVCASKGEWRRIDRESEEATHSHQDNYSKQGKNN